MKLSEAQRILNKNGLLMEESLVNTRYIDNKIEQLQKIKSELFSLGIKVESIYRKLGITGTKYNIYSNGDEWYLVTEFEDGGSFDYSVKGEQIEINYTINGYGSKTCTYDRLEITIKRIFRKQDKE